MIAGAIQSLGDGGPAALAQLKGDLANGERADSVAQALEDRSNQTVAAIDEPQAVFALVRDYALLQRREPSAEVLSDWIETHFTGPGRDDLLPLIAAMSEAGIRRTFEIADTEATEYQLILGEVFNVAIFACQEDVPWNSRDEFRSRRTGLPQTTRCVRGRTSMPAYPERADDNTVTGHADSLLRSPGNLPPVPPGP